MGVEYRGSDFLYLVYIPEDSEPFRLFNQTSGSSDSSADEIELDTKDKSGSDYGSVTETISVEGILTEGDNAIKYVTKAQRKKEFVKIIEVNTKTEETEEGMYMLSSVNKSYDNGEYATYTIDATLNGSIKEDELNVVPEGAPESDIEEDGEDDEEGK